MNVDGLPIPKFAAAETELESTIEAILSDTKTAMTRAAASLVLHMRRCPAACPLSDASVPRLSAETQCETHAVRLSVRHQCETQCETQCRDSLDVRRIGSV